MVQFERMSKDLSEFLEDIEQVNYTQLLDTVEEGSAQSRLYELNLKKDVNADNFNQSVPDMITQQFLSVNGEQYSLTGAEVESYVEDQYTLLVIVTAE